MKLRPRRREDFELNVTPLIDVVFLLLIFFMVSTTFEKQSQMKITLPEASEEVTDKIPDSVTVEVDTQGRVFVNKKSLLNSQSLTIREAIRDATHDMKTPTVIIRADANATHQSVIKVMDAARQLGLVKITFATQKAREE